MSHNLLKLFLTFLDKNIFWNITVSVELILKFKVKTTCFKLINSIYLNLIFVQNFFLILSKQMNKPNLI